MPGVSCKALATQNSSEWPCSMCPIPPGSGLWGSGHLTCIFLIFPGHLPFWTPLQIPVWGPLLGCTLLHRDESRAFGRSLLNRTRGWRGETGLPGLGGEAMPPGPSRPEMTYFIFLPQRTHGEIARQSREGCVTRVLWSPSSCSGPGPCPLPSHPLRDH